MASFYLAASLVHRIRMEKEIEEIDYQDAVFRTPGLDPIPGDYYLPEGITYHGKGTQLLLQLAFIKQRQRRLDVISPAGEIRYEINLILAFPVSAIICPVSVRHDTDIHEIAPYPQLIVDYILHDMGLLDLPEADPGIPDTYIREIEFVRGFDVILPFYVISLCAFDHVGFLDEPQIARNRLVRHPTLSPAPEWNPTQR